MNVLGDKQETAINIGYSSLLLTENMIDVFVVDGDTEDAVTQQMDQYLKTAGGGGIEQSEEGKTIDYLNLFR